MPVRLALVASLALAACGPSDPLPFAPASATAAPAPSERGPFPVGVRTVTFEDTGRRKLDGSPRVLVTEIWYPATQATRGKPGTLYDIKALFTVEQQASLGEVPLFAT